MKWAKKPSHATVLLRNRKAVTPSSWRHGTGSSTPRRRARPWRRVAGRLRRVWGWGARSPPSPHSSARCPSPSTRSTVPGLSWTSCKQNFLKFFVWETLFTTLPWQNYFKPVVCTYGCLKGQCQWHQRQIGRLRRRHLQKFCHRCATTAGGKFSSGVNDPCG